MSANDPFSKHEVTHTSLMIAEMIDNYLCSHGAVEANPEWKKLAEELHDLANKFYSTVFNDEPSPNKRLLEIIKKKSFKTGNFTLSSGLKSKHFFDLKPTMLDGEGLNLLTQSLYFLMNNNAALRYFFHGERNDPISFGGMAVGAVPLVTNIVAKLNELSGINVGGFFVRKETKNHGTQQKIEGELISGQDVVLIEDVTTTGASLLKVVEAVKEQRCKVLAAYTIIDRCEGGAEALLNEGIWLNSLFTKKDFI